MHDDEIKKLYTSYGFVIYGRCMRILRSHEDARDAMQVVFMQLVEKYHTIRDKNSIVPWIFRSAQNHCFNVLRFSKRFDNGCDQDDIPCFDQFDERLSKEQIIRLAMESHNQDVRDAVYYTYIEELEQEDIRSITGQSPATIRRNLKRFKDSLPNIRKRLGI